MDEVSVIDKEWELESMQELYTYIIKIEGQLVEKNFNMRSPYRITGVREGPDATLFTVYADQSGLIGLVRYLHQQGFVLLSVNRDLCNLRNESKNSHGSKTAKTM